MQFGRTGYSGSLCIMHFGSRHVAPKVILLGLPHFFAQLLHFLRFSDVVFFKSRRTLAQSGVRDEITASKVGHANQGTKINPHNCLALA